MYGWNERPTKAPCNTRIGGDNPARVITIGRCLIQIPDDPESDISYTVPGSRRIDSDIKQALPNIEVEDGHVKFPITDIVPMILAQLEPAELARELWQNDEVKREFVDAMIERYSYAGVDNVDRRKVVKGLNEAIYNSTLDRAVSLLQSLETRFGNKWFFWQQIAYAEQVVKNIYPEAADVHIASPDADPQFKITGQNWNEAREFWRDEIKALFPVPEAEPEMPEEDPLFGL